MLGYHSISVTLYQGLQLVVLRKTIRIVGDTKYHNIQCSYFKVQVNLRQSVEAVR
jgi:hypothetical protein